jgi:hypothetical protein
MSNQLSTQANTLAKILAANRLSKSAEQQIDHKGLLDQDNLGKEQTNEIHENIAGVNADTAAAANKPQEQVDNVPGAQDLNKEPEAALSATGTTVNTITSDGCATGTPAQVAKSASEYRSKLASILSGFKKAAAAQHAQGETPKQNDFRTGTEVLAKFASLTPTSTKEDIMSAQQEMVKLASTNPVFQICKERIMMEKMAEDIDALAAAEGITPDQAAEELQAAADANPEMMQDLEDEAAGEAVADLAGAEEATGDLMEGVQALADNASANLQTDVTSDDILNAIEQVSAEAEAAGVPPEALIQAAAEQMFGGADVSPEDEAAAQALLDEAAKKGVSPDEVIQMAVEELGGGAAPEAAPAEPPAETPAEGGNEKAASLQKRASTLRAAFVQELRHRKA